MKKAMKEIIKWNKINEISNEISIERNHGANTVHAFITKIKEHIKQIIPNVVKTHYFR